MELKVIIWIIIGLFYLITRFNKKKPVPPVQQRRGQEEIDSNPTDHKPMTFEELLIEIEGTKRSPEPATYEEPKKAPVDEVYDYEDEPVAETKPLEDTNYDYRKHDEIYETYQKAKEAAFFRPSLEESTPLGDTIVRFKEFKPYETEKKTSLAAEYVNELKNPSNFKKAFILSEILNRRF
ncbi:MAG TPA: hypothetical protein VG737_17265 [Cyclobacteriaceae bacterium]|nr:hypothetical protein [Cyclobacteriaceae bacterium]